MSLKGTKFLAHGAVNVELGGETPEDCSKSQALDDWESVGERQKGTSKKNEMMINFLTQVKKKLVVVSQASSIASFCLWRHILGS